MKAFGYGLSIACDGTVKALWALNFPVRLARGFVFSKLAARIQKCPILLPSAGTVDYHAPSTGLILRLPVRVTKHCCFPAYLPAAGCRGTAGRTIRTRTNKKTNCLFLHKPYLSLLHEAMHFFCGLWSSETRCHYQKPNVFYEGFCRQKSLLDSADAEMLIKAEIL